MAAGLECDAKRGARRVASHTSNSKRRNAPRTSEPNDQVIEGWAFSSVFSALLAACCKQSAGPVHRCKLSDAYVHLTAGGDAAVVLRVDVALRDLRRGSRRVVGDREPCPIAQPT